VSIKITRIKGGVKAALFKVRVERDKRDGGGQPCINISASCKAQ
jgi:hypothetical protein